MLLHSTTIFGFISCIHQVPIESVWEEEATARGFVLVLGVTLAAPHHHLASRNTSRYFTKLLPNQETPSVPCPATAASVLSCLAIATLAVTSVTFLHLFL